MGELVNATFSTAITIYKYRNAEADATNGNAKRKR